MVSLILQHFQVNGRNLDLQYAEGFDGPGDMMELQMADISTFTVFSPLPKNARMMNGERGRVEIFLRNGTSLVFDLSLSMAKCLFDRIRSFLHAVCGTTPRWEQRYT